MEVCYGLLLGFAGHLGVNIFPTKTSNFGDTFGKHNYHNITDTWTFQRVSNGFKGCQLTIP